MKQIVLSLALLTVSAFAFAQKKLAEVAKFKAEVVDQGKLKQNKPEDVTFVVTNIGTEPLLIEQATPGCGCTAGDYTKAPIAPGQTGTITARYNAANVGPFTKNLTVKFAGIDETISLTLKGEVVGDDAAVAVQAQQATPTVATAPAVAAPKSTKKSVKKPAKTKTK